MYRYQGEKGVGGMDWEIGVGIYNTLLRVK